MKRKNKAPWLLSWKIAARGLSLCFLGKCIAKLGSAGFVDGVQLLAEGLRYSLGVGGI